MKPDKHNWRNVLEESASYLIYRVGRLSRFQTSQFFKEVGVDITPEQWVILLRLFENDGQSQGDLADRNFHDYPNITRMVDALERRFLVTRTPDPGDRRKFLIHLTQKGSDLVESLLPQVVEMKKNNFIGLAKEDRHSLMSLLRKIENNLLNS